MKKILSTLTVLSMIFMSTMVLSCGGGSDNSNTDDTQLEQEDEDENEDDSVDPSTIRVSLSSDDEEGDSAVDDRSAVSGDGRYVVFSSDATNVVANDTNGLMDIFRRDMQTGMTIRVSVADDESQSNGTSVKPSISYDGRYVVFESNASNLVSGDTNVKEDVFIRDIDGGTTERISVSSAGVEGNNNSSSASISSDGKFVAFMSYATNLVVGDTNALPDIFLRDIDNDTTERVSVTTAGAQGTGGGSGATLPAISDDGRYVVFESTFTNLVAGDTNGEWDVFVRDTQDMTTERVSISDAEAEGTGGGAYYASISGDGRYISFTSQATNLVTGDTNATADVFVRDTQDGTTTRVSVSSDGTQTNNWSDNSKVSADGKYVFFYSDATNLVDDDTNATSDVFAYEMSSGDVSRLSVSTSGTEGDDTSDNPSCSADGRYVSFRSVATNLVSDDTNSVQDIFVRDRGN